jgi:hypothetical protein
VAVVTGFGGGSPGNGSSGFRVFTVGRDAASRFRVRPPWRVRPNAGPFERALVALLTFVLALPIAIVIIALALVALVIALGCGAVWFAFAIAIWLAGRLFGKGGPRAARAPDAGRENVRVIPPRE